MHFMVLVLFRVFDVSTLCFPGLYFFGLCLFAGFLCFVSQVAWLVLCGSVLKCPISFESGQVELKQHLFKEVGMLVPHDHEALQG